ncbi:MAG: tetratricopeptide repeat protein [Syntrophobacterales bacterium]|jgi:tetratricopeptide (TPR) repeat protein|nr:tetratricopeptide repeat protein [Syntrophobacterales bacterium]
MRNKGKEIIKITCTAFIVIVFFSLMAGCTREQVKVETPSNQTNQSSFDLYYHYSLGVQLKINNDLDGAIREYEKAILLDPFSEVLTKELAELYFDKDDFSKAIVLCQNFLKENKNNVEIQLILGELYFNTRDYKNAVTTYQSVLELDRKNTTAYFYLGSTYAEAKRYDLAAISLRKMIALDPENLMGNYYLARVLKIQKKYTEAEATLKKVISLHPGFDAPWIDLCEIYELQDNVNQAIAAYRDYLNIFPDKLTIRVRLGELLMLLKQDEEAEKEFLTVLKLDSANREARHILGILYLGQEKHNHAAEQFLNILQNTPADMRAVFFLATVYEGQGHMDDALKEYRRIPPAATSFFSQSQVRIAMILHKKGDTDEAKQIIRQAIQTDQNVAYFYSILAHFYEEGKNYPLAEAVLKDGLVAVTEKEDLHYQLGTLFSKTERVDESLQEMKKILKENPNHADALNFIGYTYAEMGKNLDEAEKIVKKALLLQPESGYIMDSLGWIYFKQNRFNEAVKYLQKAVKITPDAIISEHLGDAYRALGLMQEAMEAYKQALELDPSVEAVKIKMEEISQQLPP